ncbi:MAG: hypothetical protein EOO50_15375 [Flavobacterium sp.]|uniref:hypothetical protein n=1 Tax=Flavobacterium sp. TaxID=239 RepID=UPI00121DF3F8|nr:hypothetical protein [Flavobacterium sp.]RZJ64503.1 MAG: hypothetical protein EOO50_15375 [Flavobacterium sp.]
MIEDLDFYQITRQLFADFQSGFFFYTLVYFGFRFSKRKEKLREFDRCATICICIGSVLFFLFWAGTIAYYRIFEDESWRSFYDRLTGPYGFSIWVPMIMYMFLPQLLWVNKLRENYLSRFVIAFLLFFSFEKFVIIVTSFHRDYLPSSWSMEANSYLPYILLGILWKFGIFTAPTAILFSVRAKKDNFAA